MQTTTLNINGMSCENCVKFVTQALSGVSGVQEVNVSLPEKRALVQHEGASVEEMIAAVEEEGYEVQLSS